METNPKITNAVQVIKNNGEKAKKSYEAEIKELENKIKEYEEQQNTASISGFGDLTKQIDEAKNQIHYRQQKINLINNSGLDDLEKEIAERHREITFHLEKAKRPQLVPDHARVELALVLVKLEKMIDHKTKILTELRTKSQENDSKNYDDFRIDSYYLDTYPWNNLLQTIRKTEVFEKMETKNREQYDRDCVKLHKKHIDSAGYAGKYENVWRSFLEPDEHTEIFREFMTQLETVHKAILGKKKKKKNCKVHILHPIHKQLLLKRVMSGLVTVVTVTNLEQPNVAALCATLKKQTSPNSKLRSNQLKYNYNQSTR